MGVVQDYVKVVAAWAERREILPEAANFKVIIRGRKPYVPLDRFLSAAQPKGEWLAQVSRRGQYLIVKREDPILRGLTLDG